MFGLGTWEILLILVVALVFIGPDQLPKVAKTIGKGIRQMRDAMSDVDHEVRRAGAELLAAADDDDEDGQDDGGDDDRDDAERRGSGLADGAGSDRPAADTEPEAVSSDVEPSAAEPKTNAEWLAHLRRPIEGRVAAAPPTRRPLAGAPSAAAEAASGPGPDAAEDAPS